MPIMVDGGYEAEITWLGATEGAGDSLRSAQVAELDLGFDGLPGSRHAGENRASCSRVTFLHPEGTEIRNVRQVTILAAEDMEVIAKTLDVPDLDPGLLGATMILRGIPDFSHVPPSSRLQAPSGLTITVDMENRPCVYPGKEIEAEAPGHGKAFLSAATGKRGVTAWVERPGRVAIGDKLKLFIPDQPAWAP